MEGTHPVGTLPGRWFVREVAWPRGNIGGSIRIRDGKDDDGDGEETLTFKPWGYPLAEYVLALGIVAAVAMTCKAQDFQPPPGSYPGNGAPVPSPEVAAPGPPPDTAAPGPDLVGKNNPESDAGDMMGFGGGGGGMGGGISPLNSVRYSATWFPNVPVSAQATQFQMFGEDLSFSHPLWIDPLNALSLTGGVRNRMIDTDAVLPETGQAIPAELWDVHLGFRYIRQLADGWTTGGGLSIGSASDDPFASIHEMNVSMNAMLRIPQGEHNAWMFSLMYSPTGQLNFPLPGVAYSWNPSPQFHANIGLPLMVMWRPDDQWQFQASYMLITNIHLKALYHFTKHFSAFAAYDWSNEAYTLLDRPEDNDRFFMYDQRLSLGLQTSFARYWSASLAAGFAFDRYMFEGTSFSTSSADRVNLGAGPFVSLNVGARF